MTVRSDITVDFSTSPRVITVASPSTSVTMQDLVDTLRTIEEYPENLGYTKLIDAEGKEQITDVMRVGITVVLQDAILQFEARGGPTAERCDVQDGNLISLQFNSVGDLEAAESIGLTAFTQVVREESETPTILDDPQTGGGGGGGGTIGIAIVQA